MSDQTYFGTPAESEELQHYGVKGMRWGVRRATRKLTKAKNQQDRDKATETLKKHREKGVKEIEKLKKKQPKLEERANDTARAYDSKAANYKRQASVKKRNAYGMFGVNEKKLAKAAKLEAKAEEFATRSENAKAKVAKNKMMIEAFEKEVKNIDTALAAKGRKALGVTKR